jgi:hypothetical protein
MAKELPGVILSLGRGTSVIAASGRLVQDDDGNPFAERIATTEAISSPLPQRIRLYQERLELRQQALAGRPAMYLHRGVVAIR